MTTPRQQIATQTIVTVVVIIIPMMIRKLQATEKELSRVLALRARQKQHHSRRAELGKGQMGSALKGSLQISCHLTGTFWVLPLTCFYLPKSARAYPFPPNLSKSIAFAAAPLGLTPFVRNQITAFRQEQSTFHPGAA